MTFRLLAAHFVGDGVREKEKLAVVSLARPNLYASVRLFWS